MALVGGSVLALGSALIALFVFGPARRRMKQLQEATVRFGAGDMTARAPDRGGDEVAALARSFNQMGDELANRARALEASDKARRQLLADVSHELMTPLTAMRGYVETLSMPELHSRPGDARPLPRHHRRGNASPRADRRRPARPRAARRRRHRDASRGRAGARAVRPRALAARARADDAIHHVRERDRAGRRNGLRRSRSPRTGAAEPGRQRAAAHAGRRRDRALG